MLTPVDRRNRYKIWDGNTGTQLFHAQEGDIGCCLRSCCQGSREFEMPFKDHADRTAFTLNKARSASAFGCCAICPKMCNIACCSVCCGFTKDLSNLTGNNFDAAKLLMLHFIQLNSRVMSFISSKYTIRLVESRLWKSEILKTIIRSAFYYRLSILLPLPIVENLGKTW